MNSDFLFSALNRKIFYMATPDDFKKFVAARAVTPVMCHMPPPNAQKQPIHEGG